MSPDPQCCTSKLTLSRLLERRLSRLRCCELEPDQRRTQLCLGRRNRADLPQPTVGPLKRLDKVRKQVGMRGPKGLGRSRNSNQEIAGVEVALRKRMAPEML